RTLMKESTLQRLDIEFTSFPIMKASETPSADEIHQAANLLGVVFDDDYIVFLERFGGAMVGSLPVFGLRPAAPMGSRWSVVEITKWFRKEGWRDTDSWYVVSEDGFGNPIGIGTDGRVQRIDHDRMKVEVLAQSFDDFLTCCCLRSARFGT